MAATLYQPVFLIIVAILTMVAMGHYNQMIWDEISFDNSGHQFFALMVAMSMAVFVGMRPISGVFVDSVNYSQYFSVIKGERFVFSWETENLLFDNLYDYFASKEYDIRIFFTLIAFIYFLGIFLACRKMFPKDTLLAFVVYLGAFSTFSYSVNGIKAGAAAAIFLIALSYREKPMLSAILTLISYGFHHSMQVVAVAYVIVLLVKNRRYYLIGWVVCLLLATLHVTFFQEVFGRLTDEQGASYLLVDKPDEISGFRIDFIIYSAIPIILGHHIINKYQIDSPTYEMILNLYTLVNAVWLLCMYAADINRIAYLSWLMYPFVLLFPFLSIEGGHRQSVYLRYVVYGHLGFTLFMEFIYYGLLHA